MGGCFEFSVINFTIQVSLLISLLLVTSTLSVPHPFASPSKVRGLTERLCLHLITDKLTFSPEL